MTSVAGGDNHVSREDRFLEKLDLALERQNDTGTLSVDHTGSELDISSSTLYQRIKNITGCTPTELHQLKGKLLS